MFQVYSIVGHSKQPWRQRQSFAFRVSTICTIRKCQWFEYRFYGDCFPGSVTRGMDHGADSDLRARSSHRSIPSNLKRTADPYPTCYGYSAIDEALVFHSPRPQPEKNSKQVEAHYLYVYMKVHTGRFVSLLLSSPISLLSPAHAGPLAKFAVTHKGALYAQ
jgi:hypothetical protein